MINDKKIILGNELIVPQHITKTFFIVWRPTMNCQVKRSRKFKLNTNWKRARSNKPM
jgi:hypothetical protein